MAQEHSGRGRTAKSSVTRRQAGGRRSYAGRASTSYLASEDDKQRALNVHRADDGAARQESMSDLVMTWVREQESRVRG